MILSFLHAVEWGSESVRNRGLATTLKIVAANIEDRFFDWRHGTETRRAVEPENFEEELSNRRHAVRYQASKSRPFLTVLKRLRLPLESTFVDVGSGKGKVLLLAAKFGFKRVVGIEFSPAFCQQARRNVAIFGAKNPTLAPIEVVEGDVTRHQWRGDETVFYLYNPFNAVIMSQFVENLERSLARHPRQIWLIYCVPLHASVLEESELFPHRETVAIWGTVIHAYTNGPQAPKGRRWRPLS